MFSLLICVHERFSPAQPSCGGRGSENLAKKLEKRLGKKIIQASLPLKVRRSVCLGMCEKGPNIRITPGGPVFNEVTPEQLDEIVAAADRFIQARQAENGEGL